MDLASASYDDNKIAWYENTDGKGTFGSQQIVSTSANGARSVFAADLDGDGDMDLASASYGDNKIAWYENTDGKGTFGSQQIVSTSANGARSVFAADLDGDGDMDLASASYSDDKIAWYENTDGKGTFGSQQIVSTSADGAHSVFAADLDGDGDMDLASASYPIKLHGTKTRTAKALLEVNRSCRRVRMVLKVYLRLTWTEMETWTWQVLLMVTIKLHGTKTRTAKALLEVNRSCRRVRMVLDSVFAADLDGDGDMDLASASWK